MACDTRECLLGITHVILKLSHLVTSLGQKFLTLFLPWSALGSLKPMDEPFFGILFLNM